MTNAEAQLQTMLEVKSAWSKGYLNFLWIEMEIERLEEEVEIAVAQKSLLEDQSWNTPIEGEINL